MPIAVKPTSHLLRLERPLHPFFAPRTVAVIGATDRSGSVGRSVMANLTTGAFAGLIAPVNRHREDVFGIKAYPTITAVPGPVDLAVIVTPAAAVPIVVRECVDAHVPAAIVISAGFN